MPWNGTYYVDKKVFSVLHVNVQSIRNKSYEIESYIADDENRFDILCFSEHWLNKSEIDSFRLGNFMNASFFCRSASNHGGTLICLKPDIGYVERNDITGLSVERVCELSAIEIFNGRMVIVTVYRTPNTDIKVFNCTMALVFERLRKRNVDVIINGDFNIPFHTDEDFFVDFRNLITSYNFTSCIYEPTRGPNCIDNILINFYHLLPFTATVVDMQVSDHKAVLINVNFPSDNVKLENKILKPITQVGLRVFFDEIENCDFSFVRSRGCNLDGKFETFFHRIMEALEVAFPEKILKLNKFKTSRVAWYNDELKTLRTKLNSLNEVYVLTPSGSNRSAYWEFRKYYRKRVAEAKKTANENYIHSKQNKVKAMWDVINHFRPAKRKNVSRNLDSDIMNNFFINQPLDITSQLSNTGDLPGDFLNRSSLASFAFSDITPNMVRDAINALKNSDSRDIYGLTVGLIKNIKNKLIFPLTTLYNDCVKNSYFPQHLKASKVIPIHKSGSVEECSNYRPVSIIPVIAKIFEIILSRQIYLYMEAHGMFDACQYGFRANKGTELAILNLVDTITREFENGGFAGVTFCDLSRAFDCVSHATLIMKLKHYGFSNDSASLIQSYLAERRQSVYFNGKLSELGSVGVGVPQGSVLGPVLFIIYVNDLSASVPGSGLVLYADDTTLINVNSDLLALQEGMLGARSGVSGWFAANSLSLNENKTQTIIFTQRQVIQPQQAVKFLGIVMDQKLLWDKHVESLANKLSKNLYLLRNLRPIANQSTCMNAYFSLFHSIMSYGILIWGHSPQAQKIFSLQRKAVRIITHMPFRADVRLKFVELKILTFPSLFIYRCLLWIRQNLDRFRSHGEVHDYNTRNASHLIPEFSRLTKSRFSMNYYAPKFYNRIPTAWKSLSERVFQVKLKTFLIEKSFYSIEEFVNCNVPS